MFSTLNINGIATLLAYLSMTFLVGFWLAKSRTLVGLFWTACGVALIYFLQASDRKPEHLVGIMVFAVVIVGLVVATWMVVRTRSRNRIHVVSARGRRQYMERIERADVHAKRQATHAERKAPEVAVGTRQPRQGRTTTAPAQTPRQRNRGGYVVNHLIKELTRSAGLEE